MRALGALLLALCATAPAAADQAGRKCYCVANGTRFEEGQVACIRTPQGARPARCEMVLNNSSWTFLDGPCGETSSLSPDGRATVANSPIAGRGPDSPRL